jgi:hypothetical protein
MLDKALFALTQRRLFVNKYFYAVALLSIFAAPAAIAKDAPTTFTHQGVTYKYTVTEVGETKKIITGYASPGAPFSLVVSKGKVTGTANGMPISFKVSDVKVRTASTSDLKVASR